MIELMVGMSLSLILCAGILAAYLFIGRNLTRLVNLQQQEVKTRHALRVFSQDISVATQLNSATSTINASGVTTAATFVAVIPTVIDSTTGNITSTANVTYTYTSGSGKLTRVRSDTADTTTILTGITSFTINYFTTSDVTSGVVFTTNASTSPSLFNPTTAVSVKAVQFQFTTQLGSSASGTLEAYTVLSPRVLLRNHVTLPLL